MQMSPDNLLWNKKEAAIELGEPTGYVKAVGSSIHPFIFLEKTEDSWNVEESEC